MAGGLLDSLFVAIGFQVDDKELKKLDKSISDKIKNIGKVFSSLGESLNNKGLKDFGGKFDEVADAAGAVITPILGVVQGVIKVGAVVAATTFAIDRMTVSLLKNNQAFINFQRQTGLSMGKSADIMQAGMLSDINMKPETIMQSMQAVQSNLSQIPLGKGNIEPFQLLGISPLGKDANQIFDDLREAIKGLDDMTATNIIQEMGFSPEMITVLRMTNEELAQTQQLMLSPQQRTALQGYSTELRKIHMGFELLKDKALIAILPYLIEFERSWLNISKAFKPITKELGKFILLLAIPLGKILYVLTMAFAGLADVFLLVLKPLNWILEGIGKFITDHPKIISALSGIGGALMLWLNPALAGVLALVLLLEDLAVWAMGGKSFLGTTMEIAGEKLKELGNWLANGFKGIGGDLSEALSNFGKFFESLKNTWNGLDDGLKHWLSGGNIGQPTMPMGGGITGVPQNTLKTASAMAGGGLSSANLSNQQTVNQNNYMSFGSADAQPVAKKITDLAFTFSQASMAV
jgi:hypothetical protein